MKKSNVVKLVLAAGLACVVGICLLACASTKKADGASVSSNSEEKYWLDESVPSFAKTYAKYFDYVGIACGHRELVTSEIQDGLYKHVNTITMGNEFKPDFVFNWAWGTYSSNLTKFTDSKGTTIKVPAGPLGGFSKIDQILGICKFNNIQLRGHVLVWHSQTPEEFFREGFKKDGALVDKETMTARQEWYIKTVIEHVQNWEKKNNGGKHIVWAWDVVNEAVQDGSNTLRPDSNWYRIYGDSEFIVNAFRFANKYVDPDVVLCYNDYNVTSRVKRLGMLKVLDDIIAASNDSVMPTRIDAMGMQSHISINTSHLDFQNAIIDFVSKGLDVQVTELDVATERTYDAAALKNYYKTLFTILLRYRKTEEKKGITSITVWGINDESTWLNSPSQIKFHGNVKQYPLLFNLQGGKYTTKPAFYGVIEAAKEYL